MIRRLLMRITKNRPMKTIWVADAPYLERYYMGQILGRQIWLHRFIRGDAERHLHNHPWRAVSVVLCGWYCEHYLSKGVTFSRFRRPLSAARIGMQRFHRVADVDAETWTLMLVGRERSPDWHFFDGGRSQQMVASRADWWRTAGRRA